MYGNGDGVLSCRANSSAKIAISVLGARQLALAWTKLFPGGEAHDLVLSSGFLAFAGHSGFLQAVEDSGVKVAGVMGTSAGALAGSLYCAGYTPRQVSIPQLRAFRNTPLHMLSCMHTCSCVCRQFDSV